MIHNFISKLFNTLNENKIGYALLRNYESMPYRPKDKEYFDLDMFVSSKDLKEFNRILNKTIENEKAILIKSFKRSYCHHFRVTKFEDNKFESVQIDVHTKGQGWWGFFYLMENEIINNRIKYKEFYVVSDFHYNLFNWLDKLLWGELQINYSEQIKLSMIKNIDHLDLFLQKIFLSKEKILAIKEIFLNRHKTTMETRVYKKIIKRKLINWSVLKHPIKTISWNIEFFMRELILRIFPPGLFIIIRNEDIFSKDLYMALQNTATIGSTSLFVNLNKKNKLQFFYEYFRTIFPIVRKHGMVICIHDKINFKKSLTLKSKTLNSHLIKEILIQYKKLNFVCFPNIIINNS